MLRVASLLAASLFATSLPASAGDGSAVPRERVAAEVARWSAFLRTHADEADLWRQVKQAAEPVMARVQAALEEGHAQLALLRFAPVRENLAASAYLGECGAGPRKDLAGLEREWMRMGAVLRDDLRTPSPEALADVRPALLRALGEAALPQVRIYYEASLEYGRSTTPDSGLFYIGAARAARDWGRLVHRLSTRSAPPAPPLRSLAADLDALEGDMLTAYRPPLSIDRHREFIGASSALKEARELEAAGLRHGALLRYLQAALRFAALRSAPPPAGDVAARLAALERRFSAGTDHSLGRVFVEAARSDLAEHAADGQAATAAAVVEDVLPRYFAALGPAPPPPVRAEPRVTVTLVRWPYT